MAIDVVLITGFLGAGKTTLLNRLLALPEVAGREPALIVNEFGQMGVDGRLVAPGPWRMYEINRGSLFCACTTMELLNALGQIAAGPADLVLVEATGIAETRDVERLLHAGDLAGRFRVHANLCVVDASGFARVSPNLRAARNQVRQADEIVLNKTDLARPDELARLRALLTELNPEAARIEVQHSAVPDGWLATLSHRPTVGEMDQAPPAGIASACVRSDRSVDRERFMRVLRDLGGKLLRLKGNVAFTDGRRFVEFSAGRLTRRDAEAGLSEPTAFTVIAADTTREQIEAAFQSALIAADA